MSDGKLKALDVSRKTEPGKYSDGGGLYLQVATADSKSWLYRHWIGGKEHWLGLGSYKDLSLSAARIARDIARGKIRSGANIVADRKLAREQTKALRKPSLTFRQAAEKYLRDHDADWKNSKHRDQWRSTLLAYAYPVIENMPVGDIRPSDILTILEPIWTTKHETAKRLRGRIEVVLASVNDVDALDYRNPAQMTLQLRNRLPARRGEKRKSHASMPFVEVPRLMVQLSTCGGVAAFALRFCILTAARTGEVLGGRWSEIDEVQRVWTVPATRMKMGNEHRVPLSDAAMQVLNGLKALRQNEWIFPSIGRSAQLSNMAMLATLQRLAITNATTHGFRASFATWAEETTEFAEEIREAALAHQYKTETIAAYQRGDKLERRRALMDRWAQFCVCTEDA